MHLLKALRSKFDIKYLANECCLQYRYKTVQNFLKNNVKVLATTNLMSRGIDNKNVQIVINFDMPYINGVIDTKIYAYRAGRTARYGSGGSVLTFLPSENLTTFKIRLQRDLAVTVEEV